jgi:hypothetical protein
MKSGGNKHFVWGIMWKTFILPLRRANQTAAKLARKIFLASLGKLRSSLLSRLRSRMNVFNWYIKAQSVYFKKILNFIHPLLFSVLKNPLFWRYIIEPVS